MYRSLEVHAGRMRPTWMCRVWVLLVAAQAATTPLVAREPIDPTAAGPSWARPARTAQAATAGAGGQDSQGTAPGNGAPSYEALLARIDQLPMAIEGEALEEAALARVRQAQARPNPAITIEGENLLGTGAYAGYRGADTTFSVNQPLDVWGQRAARVDAAEAQAEVAGLQREQRRVLIAWRLAQLYTDAEAAALRHALALDALALAEEEARAARTLVSEGREPAVREIQAESEVYLARAVADESRASRAAAFARLAAMAMLDEPIGAITASLLDRTLAPEPAVPAPDDSIAVRIARAHVDVAGRLVDVERLRARPTLTAALGVRRFEASGDGAMTFALNMSVPLFDRNRDNLAAAQAERRAAEARVVAEQRDAQAERIAARAGLEASSSRTRAADNSVRAAEEAYRLSRIGFDAGRMSQLELRVARAALVAAQNAAVDARLARARAEIDLARVEGRVPFGATP